MSNYIQIKNQIQKLQREAEILRKRERAETITKIKEAIAAFELTAEDLGLSSTVRGRRGTGGKSPVKRRGQKSEKIVATSNQRQRKKGGKSINIDKRSVVAPKYRDPSTNTTWTGRGKQPKWLSAAIKDGKKLEDFKI
jgi:DNA-binding protein H-NS